MSTEHTELLRALPDEHSGALTRFVYHLTGDSALAQDVVQETLLRAWKHPDILERSTGSARAWLFTVARNLVIDERRSAHHRHELATGAVPERSTPDQIDAVRHYTGGDTPALSRLGGSEWAKTKARVRSAVAEIAQELVVLYQRRTISASDY